MSKRTKGIIVIFDKQNKKVLVQDDQSPYRNEELDIASTHENITLASGMVVDFLISVVQTKAKKPSIKAADVSPSEEALISLISTEKIPAKKSMLWKLVEETNKDFCEESNGSGSKHHRYLQSLIKNAAEKLGWAAAVEQGILEGTRFVDVSLQKGGIKIACEVSISNSPKNEAQNIQKAFEANYTYIISIATEEKKLKRIRKSLPQKFLEEEKILFFLPEEFISFLEEVSSKINTSSPEKEIRGYRVKVIHLPISPEESIKKREIINSIVINSMRKRKNTSK